MPPSSLDELFDAQGEPMTLPGGAVLYAAGQEPEALFRLISGRLAVTEPISSGGSRLLRAMRPGEIVGAGPLITGAPYSLTATALRDSELSRLPKAKVDLAAASAAIYAQLARTALDATEISEAASPRKAAILGFVAVCDSVPMRDVIERLASCMRALSFKVAVLGREALGASAATLSTLEDANDFLLMGAERSEVDYTQFLGRQIDRLILVGGVDSPLPELPFQFAALAIRRHQLLDLVIIQSVDCPRPRGTARWLAAAPAARLFHIRGDSPEDMAHLARVFSGRSVGLAFSGGGARAYAGVGVAKAMRELRIPMDFLAGTSMGAVIAAGLAMGWDIEELDWRIRAAFVESSPLADITFPLLAMTGGRTVDERLKTHFGDVEICDLWRPFTCVSTDLTLGEMHTHRAGLLHRALRASVSLPGVLPPVIEDGHVLVDGALVRNLPVDIVKQQHEGITIGVDVVQASGLTPEDLKLHPSGWRWLLSGAWRRGPPIVSVLIRSATMPTARAMAAARDPAAIIITPGLEGIELRDWKAYAPAVEAGYRATMAQAEALSAYAV